MSLAQSVVPSKRVDRDVDLRALAVADLLADEEHRGFVALALPDHHRSVDLELVQLAPHGVDRRLIRRFLVASPSQAGGSDGGAFGDAHELQGEDAFDDLVGSNRDGLAHGVSSS